MSTTRRDKWPPPLPISPSGRAAAWTVAACLAIAGVATVVLAWNELTCTVPVDPGGPRQAPETACEVLAGVGGLFSFLGGLAAAGGIAIAWRTRMRPVEGTGKDGWRWGLAVVFTIGFAVLVTRFPDQTCPGGAHLSAPFGLCIDTATDARFDSTSWIWAKVIAIVAAPVIGFTVIAARRASAIAVPLTLIAWFAGIGWLLLDTIGREFLP